MRSVGSCADNAAIDVISRSELNDAAPPELAVLLRKNIDERRVRPYYPEGGVAAQNA